MPPVASPSSSPPSSLPRASPRNGSAPAASRPGPAPRRVSTSSARPVAIGEDGAGAWTRRLAGRSPWRSTSRRPPRRAAARSGWSPRPRQAGRPGLPTPSTALRRRPLRDLVDAAARRAFCQAASTLAVRRPDGSQTACVYAGFLDFDAAASRPREEGPRRQAAPLRTLAELFAAEPRLLEPAGPRTGSPRRAGRTPRARRAPLECLVTFSGLKASTSSSAPRPARPGPRGARQGDGQVEPRRPRRPAYSVDDLLETALVPLLRRLPASPRGRARHRGGDRQVPLNPNCGLRLDEYPHPLTGGTPSPSRPRLDALIEPDARRRSGPHRRRRPRPEISAFLSGLFADLERRVGRRGRAALPPSRGPSAPREGAARAGSVGGTGARPGAAPAARPSPAPALELAPHHRDRRARPQGPTRGRSEDGRYVTFRVSPRRQRARATSASSTTGADPLLGLAAPPGASMVRSGAGPEHSDCARRPVFGARLDGRGRPGRGAATTRPSWPRECLSSIADGARGGAPPAAAPSLRRGARGVLVDVLAREVKAFPCAGCKRRAPRAHPSPRPPPELGSELRAAEDAVQRASSRGRWRRTGPRIALFGRGRRAGWRPSAPRRAAGEQLVAIIEVLRQRVVAKDCAGRAPLPTCASPSAARGGGFDWRDIVHDANDLGDPRRRWWTRRSRGAPRPATRRGMLFLRAQTGTGKSQAIVHLLAEMRKSPPRTACPSTSGSSTSSRADPRRAPPGGHALHGDLRGAWTSYKEMTPGQLAQASAQLMSTVESIQRLEGAFQVVVVDEGAKALATLALSTTLAKEGRHSAAPDVDFYVGLFLGAARRGGARGPEPFVRVVLSADDRRALFATLASSTPTRLRARSRPAA
eukprot:tig00021440_g21531.t1